MRSGPHRCSWLALLLLMALGVGGCTSAERRAAIANSAASSWEAAHAIELMQAGPVEGVDSRKVVAAAVAIIKLQSAAQIKAVGFTYQPAGVTDE